MLRLFFCELLMSINKINFRHIISLVFILDIGLSEVTFNFSDTFPELIMGNVSMQNGFQGGLNKPRVQWIDHDDDGDTDIFLLDMDGFIRFYENKGSLTEHEFVLVTTRFQEIQKTGWFSFRDFDLDDDLDLVTQNIEALWGSYSGIRYYVNMDGIFNLLSDTLITNFGNPLLSNNQSTPTFSDIDNDGDEDFFSGNLDGTLTFYENLGIEDGKPVFEFITDNWQNISIIGRNRNHEDYRHGASAITFIDLDGDSDLDLSWGDYFQQSVYIIWNVGTPETPNMDIENIEDEYPSFEPVQTGGQNMPTFADLDFFHSHDLYTGSVVDHADIDSDGDLDMFIGTEIDYSVTPFRGKIQYFNNSGSSDNPVWTLEDSDFLGTNLGYNLAPCFGDLDNDGDQDLLLGDYNGKIFVFIRNDIEPVESSYQNMGELNEIDLSGRSHPELVDIDSDGDLDLFIGENWGVIHFYENIGTEDVYEFSFVTDLYFEIDVGYYSSPEFSDLDSDGDFDLFVGNQEGEINFFINTGSSTNAQFQMDSSISFPYIGGNSNFSLGDFYGEGRLDVIAGLYTGGLYYLKGDSSGTLDINDSNLYPSMFELHPAFPNPFNPVTTIEFSVMETMIGPNISMCENRTSLQIFDIRGKWVKTLVDKKLPLGNYSAQWNGEDMSSGVYFVKLQNSKSAHTQKIILLK